MPRKKDVGPNSAAGQPVDREAPSPALDHLISPIVASAIPNWLVPGAFVASIFFIIGSVGLAVKFPTPTPFQFFVFRIVAALGAGAFSMALSGSLKITKRLPWGGQLVAGGAIAVFVLLYLVTPAIPGVPKPEPLVDSRGHPLASPANDAELQVIRLQDEIMDLRQYKESVQYPDSRRRLKDAPYLAERILGFSDASLNPRRRYIKYEYAAFAYVDAAAAAMFDDRPRVEEYTSRVFKSVDTAVSMLDAAERTYQSDENSRFLLDWVVKDNGKDRVLYLRADAECMLGTVKNDATLKAQASETWNLISPTYRAGLPAEGTPQLSGCVSK